MNPHERIYNPDRTPERPSQPPVRIPEWRRRALAQRDELGRNVAVADLTRRAA